VELEAGCAEKSRSSVELQNLLLLVSARELFPGWRSLKWEPAGLRMPTGCPLEEPRYCCY